MRNQFGYAWGKLYLAVTAMCASEGTSAERVTKAYRQHLGSLNSQNLPPHGYERLRQIRQKFARAFSNEDEEDATLSLVPLTSATAAAIAEEIVSLFDEVAKQGEKNPL